MIENRLCDDCTIETLIKDNLIVLELAKVHNVNYILIDEKYEIPDIKLLLLKYFYMLDLFFLYFFTLGFLLNKYLLNLFP